MNQVLRKKEIIEYVGRCAQLSALLEVAAYPKPGNVHRLHDFQNTKFEHFLAGSTALTFQMGELASFGYEVKQRKRTWPKIGIGKHIFNITKSSLDLQSGGNVNLGITILFAPIATAAGYLLDNDSIEIPELKTVVNIVTNNTTPQDSKFLYRAINLAMSEKVLGKTGEFDVTERSSIYEIKRKKTTMRDIFLRCAEKDSICSEWVTDFGITLNNGYPFLIKSLEKNNVNTAIVETFLYLLSERPDSLITRKMGLEVSTNVSKKAKEILLKGEINQNKIGSLIWDFDKELQSAGGQLNPGTTADLTAASIFLVLLKGWRL